MLKAHRWCTNASAAPEAFRPILEGNALFGIGCSVLEAGATIAVGDTLVIDQDYVRNAVADIAKNADLSHFIL